MSKKKTSKLVRGKELKRLFKKARQESEKQNKAREEWKKTLSKKKLKEFEDQEKENLSIWRAMTWEPNLLLMAAENYRHQIKKTKSQ